MKEIKIIREAKKRLIQKHQQEFNQIYESIVREVRRYGGILK